MSKIDDALTNLESALWECVEAGADDDEINTCVREYLEDLEDYS